MRCVSLLFQRAAASGAIVRCSREALSSGLCARHRRIYDRAPSGLERRAFARVALKREDMCEAFWREMKQPDGFDPPSEWLIADVSLPTSPSISEPNELARATRALREVAKVGLAVMLSDGRVAVYCGGPFGSVHVTGEVN